MSEPYLTVKMCVFAGRPNPLWRFNAAWLRSQIEDIVRLDEDAGDPGPYRSMYSGFKIFEAGDQRPVFDLYNGCLRCLQQGRVTKCYTGAAASALEVGLLCTATCLAPFSVYPSVKDAIFGVMAVTHPRISAR